MSKMTPQEIVHELDKHIIGQDSAKRAVAIALRNRWRRQQVADPLRQEITPKNILMIGPTGVGKTEIARIELTGNGSKLDAFLDAIDRSLILETVRTGVSGIGRGDRILKV